MEALLKLLVALAMVAGLIWVLSPVLTATIYGEMEKTPNLKISRVFFDIAENPQCDCAPTMCQISASGSLTNLGGPAKNILLTMYFYDSRKNLGSVNLPLIAEMGAEQSTAFAYAVNFSCDTSNVSVSVTHFQKA